MFTISSVQFRIGVAEVTSRLQMATRHRRSRHKYNDLCGSLESNRAEKEDIILIFSRRRRPYPRENPGLIAERSEAKADP